MPIPVPQDEHHLGECIRFLRREGKPPAQCAAICYDLARRRAGKKVAPKEKKKW